MFNRFNGHIQGRKNQGGFTLIELVVVIILLGILSVGVTRFIKLGTQIYVDNTNRDEIIGSARFAVERLNRELRTALPYSVAIDSSVSECLKYTPIVASTIYVDIPVAPEPPRKSLSVIKFQSDLVSHDYRVAVYPLSNDDVYSNSTQKIFSLSGSERVESTSTQWDITFDNDIQFAQDSPTKRLYFIDTSVSYCMDSGQLRRFVGNDPNSGENFEDGVLMAEHIDDGASYFEATSDRQNRNATVLMRFVFERNDEQVTFNNEVQIANVP